MIGIGAEIERVGARAAVQRIRTGAAAYGVIARTAQQRVVAGAAVDDIITRAAIDEIGHRAAGQAVVIGCAGYVLDVDIAVAQRIAAAADTGIEIDRDRRRAGGIIDRVGPRAAVHRIRTGPAEERVVAIAAPQRVVAGAAIDQVVAIHALDEVVAGIAGQRVVEIRARQILDVHQRIAERITLCAGAGGQRNRHRRGRRLIGHGVGVGAAVDIVGTRAAIDRIGACTAIERVVARTTDDGICAIAAIDDIGVGITGQRVVVIRSDKIGDAVECVAIGIADCAGASQQRGGDRRGCGRIAGGVGAAAADQRIGPGPADQRVIAQAAVDDIGPGGADQQIGIGRADNILDRIAKEHIARRIATRVGDRAVERHRHPGPGGAVIDYIGAVAADQRVGASPADQRVVAVAAVEIVVARATRQRIVARACIDRGRGAIADKHIVVRGQIERFDIGDDVALRIAGRERRIGQIER